MKNLFLSINVYFLRFEIKQKLKTAKKKEKEEKKKKQEEEQEKRKLSQVPDTQVVSKLYSQQALSKNRNTNRVLHSRFLSPFMQVMSHNKERRIKRDEKLDKKSQAMEELKAEREKRKNRTGTFLINFSSLIRQYRITY